VGRLTQEVLADLVPVARRLGHEVTHHGLDGLPAVLADEQLLRQVLQNLASNAVKYTPPGGRIHLDVAQQDAEVRWRITDNGIGIPEAARSRLFEKFFRADNVTAVETEGTGLGLYMVRLIVERAHGRIWHEPVTSGGSRFVLALPIAVQAGLPAGPAVGSLPERGERALS
jgi:two-component system sensor histidine kinase VicK